MELGGKRGVVATCPKTACLLKPLSQALPALEEKVSWAGVRRG